MTNVTEIAPDVYRVSTYNANYKLQFNQFVVKDDEPLLFHTGMKGEFPHVKEAVSRVLDPASIRWISFSHFESDECGSLNEWLQTAPQAQPLCTVVAALVNRPDFAHCAPPRPGRVLAPAGPPGAHRSAIRTRPTRNGGS